MAIVVDLQLGRPLGAVCPHDAVVELLDETRRGVGDRASDLANLPAISLPAHVDGTVYQAAGELNCLPFGPEDGVDGRRR